MSCRATGEERPRSEPIATSGATARSLLARSEFDWRVLETPHARLHAPRNSRVFDRVGELADSVELARTAALSALGETDRADEPKIEIFFVDTRDDMKRIAGRPIAGFAQPGELTAVFVAGPGYKPLLRHELTHAISFVRWGEIRTGIWLAEGIAALAQGKCQGKSVDGIAAGHLANGKLPSVELMMRDFRSVPELQGYIAAASFIDNIRKRRGHQAIRAAWQGQPIDSVDQIEREWHSELRAVKPAALDSARLYREGC